jgi:hypothetical protein
MLYTSARVAGRTNAYVSSAFQRAIHLSSRPSSAGRSGTPAPGERGAAVRGSAEMVTIVILEKAGTPHIPVSFRGRLPAAEIDGDLARFSAQGHE